MLAGVAQTAFLMMKWHGGDCLEATGKPQAFVHAFEVPAHFLNTFRRRASQARASNMRRQSTHDQSFIHEWTSTGR